MSCTWQVWRHNWSEPKGNPEKVFLFWRKKNLDANRMESSSGSELSLNLRFFWVSSHSNLSDTNWVLKLESKKAKQEICTRQSVEAFSMSNKSEMGVFRVLSLDVNTKSYLKFQIPVQEHFFGSSLEHLDDLCHVFTFTKKQRLIDLICNIHV